eukprot:8442007-Lingulodinium_polyedra.AAC.1
MLGQLAYHVGPKSKADEETKISHKAALEANQKADPAMKAEILANFAKSRTRFDAEQQEDETDNN